MNISFLAYLDCVGGFLGWRNQAQGQILKKIRTSGVREIKSIEIGEIMMNALKEVDSVAYVRFASVYRDFQDIKDFSEEISSLSKEKPKSNKSKK